jgi:hypothetical protein
MIGEGVVDSTAKAGTAIETNNPTLSKSEHTFFIS